MKRDFFEKLSAAIGTYPIFSFFPQGAFVNITIGMQFIGKNIFIETKASWKLRCVLFAAEFGRKKQAS